MRHFIAAAVSASALALAPTSAHAVELVETFTPGDPQFQIFGDITQGPITAALAVGGIVAGEFTHTFAFTVPQSGLGSGSITTSVAQTGFLSTIDTDFISILVNGSAVNLTKSTNNLIETGSATDVPITANGPNSIVVSGISRGNGSYGGNLTFIPGDEVPAVPEPATWAMMLFGFGAIGFGMRRRKSKEKLRVRYAF
ncbi:FxDxF family PEP-CTERM protein [Parafrankia sp. BMG5.11]|uniref:FxDxF family PEP-CTERM protein n=1 Tax=Parafrankia sp. BMG5.11 TaxID=222540 RepID=UPI00103E8AAB|nr:FxDxF family PEP-CTERM protein [Parafrankia sp. BMG5.11]TCJ32186.1 PEP-CTERM sorting domain-containing protein [Parafrankia sp. BMG5.11]